LGEELHHAQLNQLKRLLEHGCHVGHCAVILILVLFVLMEL
jgi:hypothetical protein